MEPNQKKTVVRVIVAAIMVLLFAAALFAFLNYYIYPKLPEATKTIVQLVSTVLLIALLVLSEFFQIAGVSIRDLVGKEEQSQGGDYEINKLIAEIRGNLYSSNDSLPSVLASCISLSNIARLPDEYTMWLKYELEGFSSIDELRNKFTDDTKYKDWMEKWFTHRLRELHAKFQYTAAETGLPRIENFPIRKFLIGFPIVEIIRKLDEARTNNVNEIYYELYDLDREAFNELKEFVAKPPLKAKLPYDLRAFLSVAEFDDILNKVRSKVIELISIAQTSTPRGKSTKS